MSRSRAALHRGLWIVLPVRGESRGKSRLAGALLPTERMRLNRRLLRRTLAVIERWQGALDSCVVVSGCARSLTLARRRGARSFREPQPRRGLSHAVARAVDHAVARGARSVLVLACDLPLLSESSLRRMLACAKPDARIVIAPDRAGTGTNAILLALRARFAYAYGADSLARHLDAARARGWVASVCADSQLAFDLDTPEDLTSVRAQAAREPLRPPRV